MKFKNETLKHLTICSNGENFNGLTVIEKVITHKFKTNLYFRMVFTDGVKFYENTYCEESVDSWGYSSFDYEGDEIECHEVFPQEKVITVYLAAGTGS